MAKAVTLTERSAGTQYQARTSPGRMAADASRGATEPRAGSGGQAVNPEQIAILAYEIWVSRGRPDGTDREDWLEAERRLRARPSGPA
jgi:hypothetical protein